MRPLEKFFYSYGTFLAQHPWPFIIIPLVLTFISSFGNLYFHANDDIWDVYAPLDGLSRVEEDALRPFQFASGSSHYRMQIIVTRKDGGNMLTMGTLDEIYGVEKLVTENITASNGLRNYHYDEMCGVYCEDSNAAVIALLQSAISPSPLSSVKLTYPITMALQRRIFLGYSLGHLTFREGQTNEISEARLFVLHYMVDTSLPNGTQLIADMEKTLRRLFASLTESSPNLIYTFISKLVEVEEQRAITLTTLPYLAVTITLLIIFMVLTSLNSPLYRSQHLESLVGIISPAMALWTSSGFLFWLGVPFSNIITVVPFLVINIGVDDAFLILAGWRQSTKGAPVEQRIAESIAIAGASVTVTSLTDVLCFAIGLFSNMPVIRLFCLFTTLALFMDFVYQLTFFTAAMSFIVRRQISLDKEASEEKMQDKLPSNEDFEAKKLNDSTVFTITMPSFLTSTIRKAPKKICRLELFVNVLHTKIVKTVVMLLFAAHIAVSSYLASQVSTDFNMANLYLESSPLTEVSRKMQVFILRESFVVNFAVKPMPDFSNETIREQFEQMVERLESIPNVGAGPDSTIFWLREYNTTVSFWEEEEDFWSPPAMLTNYREYGMDQKFIITRMNEDGEEVMDGFYFMITYHNMSCFMDLLALMNKRRAIIAEYPFTVHSHHPLEKVPTESAASAPYNFVQTAVSAMVLMSILVLIFVMIWEAVISVVLSIMSICLGVVGYLHLWGVALDAVSLISILMSVGFSVDYSAHICYHYFAHASKEQHKAKSDSGSAGSESGRSDNSGNRSLMKSETEPSVNRLLATFGGVGWPVIQSGLSTMIGIIPLMLVQSYVVAVFWKTILLVGILGMSHALVLLPVIFILTEDVKRFFRSM